MRIGVLGSGLMGTKLGTILARAGHDVVFSYSRSRERLEQLAKDAGRQVDWEGGADVFVADEQGRQRHGSQPLHLRRGGPGGPDAARARAVVEQQGWTLDGALVGIAGIGLTFRLWWVYYMLPSANRRVPCALVLQHKADPDGTEIRTPREHGTPRVWREVIVLLCRAQPCRHFAS